MDNAAVVGYGVVGQATAKVLGIKKHFDIDEERSNCTLTEVANCRYVLICLPTPFKNDKHDTTAIFDIVKQINDIKQGAIFIIRSTVWPGFADTLFNELRPEAVISNPEFLSEKTAEKDAKNPPFILIGGMEGRFRDEVAAIWRQGVKTAEIIMTDNISAEMAKLALNAFFSTKVVFANEIYDACQKVNANYESVRKILEKHPFGMNNHTDIYYNGVRGVRGKCLPKDLKGFTSFLDLPLLKTVEEINQQLIR